MDSTAWATALDTLRQYTFKITTPQGAGTGFMLTRESGHHVCGIATAYHVIKHAHEWEEPIKLQHTATGGQVVIRAQQRYIFTDPARDVAVTMFTNEDIALPPAELTLVPEDKHIKPGIPIGWAGYPAVAPNEFSFFSGAVSCFLEPQLSYLVDGVAINGVSGGPAFTVLPENVVHLVGVVSAYIPNRMMTGESLPGVCFVVGMHSFYQFIKQIKSVEEAQEKQKQLEAEQSSGGDSSKATPGLTGTPHS